MRKFIWELHAHTSEVSPCSATKADDIVRTLKLAGYDGVVVTDHYSIHSMKRGGVSEASAAERFDFFRRGYELAMEAGEKYGLRVIPGAEVCLYENRNDYLIYGDVPKFLSDFDGDLLALKVRELSEAVRAAGLMIFQAHPFRDYMTIVAPQYLDGIEVMNLNPSHDSRNAQARRWAEDFGLIMCGGSDYHEFKGLAGVGVATAADIKTSEDLLSALRCGFEIIDHPFGDVSHIR